MSDSDETICDNTEYDNRVLELGTQDSPSIFSAAVSRANSTSNKASNDGDDKISQQTEVALLSPECLPPSAKVKRTETPSTSSTSDIAIRTDIDTNAPKDSCVSSKDVRSSPEYPPPSARMPRAKGLNDFGPVDIPVSTDGGSVPEASKLRTIKEHEKSAEELLIVLKKQGSAGSDLRKCPHFLRAKSLLAAIHPQLVEFSRSQQQERSKLLAHQSPQTEYSQECPGAGWSQEDKQRLQELANRQRELLKLFKKHKELVGRLQSLKHADKANKGHLLPCLEKHFESSGGTGSCEKAAASTDRCNTAVSSSSHSCSIPEPSVVHTQSESMCTNTSATSALQARSELVSLQIVPSSIGTPVGSTSVQPALQQIVLTGGQLYQIGGQQVYVIPKAALPTPVCAIQASVTQATCSITTTTTAAAAITPVDMVHNQLNVTSSQGLSTTELPPTSRVPMVPVTRQPSFITEPGPTAQAASSNSISRNSVFSGSSQPQGKQATRSTCTGTQVVFSGHGTLSSSTVHTHSSVPSPSPTERLAYKPTSNKQKPGPATKSVACSTRTTTLVRRHSFQSDLPALKCLLDHGVIDAGPNLLSVQFEGKRFEASLMPSGFIKSAEGETFHTPMAWLKAVSHSKTTWRQAKTYRTISYKGKPLVAYSIAQAAGGSSSIQINRSNTSLGFSESQFSQENTPDVSQQQCLRTGIHAPPSRQDSSQQNTIRTQLMSCHDDLSKFLRNCHVMPISDQEFVPSNTFLPSDFWISKSEVKLSMSLIKELDF